MVEKQVRNDFSVLDTTGRRISSAFLFGLESEQGKVVTIKEFGVFVFNGSNPIDSIGQLVYSKELKKESLK